MKSVACLCLLVVVVALSARSADAIVCTPNFCAAVRCARVDAAACDGVVRHNASFCGCCDACIRIIPSGGSCFNLIEFGAPPTSECAEGTACFNQVCTPLGEILLD